MASAPGPASASGAGAAPAADEDERFPLSRLEGAVMANPAPRADELLQLCVGTERACASVLIRAESAEHVRLLSHRVWLASVASRTLCGIGAYDVGLWQREDPVLRYWATLAASARVRFREEPTGTAAQLVCSAVGRMSAWLLQRAEGGGGCVAAAMRSADGARIVEHTCSLLSAAVQYGAQATAVLPGDEFSMSALARASERLLDLRMGCARLLQGGGAGPEARAAALAVIRAPSPATCLLHVCWLYSRACLAGYPCQSGDGGTPAVRDRLSALLAQARGMAADEEIRRTWARAKRCLRRSLARSSAARQRRAGEGRSTPSARLVDGLCEQAAAACSDCVLVGLVASAHAAVAGGPAAECQSMSESACAVLRLLARAGRVSPADVTSGTALLQACVPLMVAAERHAGPSPGPGGARDAAALSLLRLCGACASEATSLMTHLLRRRRLHDSVASSVFAAAWARAVAAAAVDRTAAGLDAAALAAAEGAEEAAARWRASVTRAAPSAAGPARRGGHGGPADDDVEDEEPAARRVRIAVLPPVRPRHGPVPGDDVVAEGAADDPLHGAACTCGFCCDGSDTPAASSSSSSSSSPSVSDPDVRGTEAAGAEFEAPADAAFIADAASVSPAAGGALPRPVAVALDRACGRAAYRAILSLGPGGPGAPITSAELRATREAAAELLGVVVVVLQWACHTGELRGDARGAREGAGKRSRSPTGTGGAPAAHAGDAASLGPSADGFSGAPAGSAGPGRASLRADGTAAGSIGSHASDAPGPAAARAGAADPAEANGEGLAAALSEMRLSVLSSAAALCSLLTGEDAPFFLGASDGDAAAAGSSSGVASAAEAVACVGLAPFPVDVHARRLPRTAFGGVVFGCDAGVCCVWPSEFERLGDEQACEPLDAEEEWGRCVAGLVGAVSALCEDDDVPLVRCAGSSRVMVSARARGRPTEAASPIPARRSDDAARAWSDVDAAEDDGHDGGADTLAHGGFGGQGPDAGGLPSSLSAIDAFAGLADEDDDAMGGRGRPGARERASLGAAALTGSLQAGLPLGSDAVQEAAARVRAALGQGFPASAAVSDAGGPAAHSPPGLEGVAELMAALEDGADCTADAARLFFGDTEPGDGDNPLSRGGGPF